jgi:hypothetical protein
VKQRQNDILDVEHEFFMLLLQHGLNRFALEEAANPTLAGMSRGARHLTSECTSRLNHGCDLAKSDLLPRMIRDKSADSNGTGPMSFPVGRGDRNLSSCHRACIVWLKWDSKTSRLPQFAPQTR